MHLFRIYSLDMINKMHWHTVNLQIITRSRKECCCFFLFIIKTYETPLFSMMFYFLLSCVIITSVYGKIIFQEVLGFSL